MVEWVSIFLQSLGHLDKALGIVDKSKKLLAGLKKGNELNDLGDRVERLEKGLLINNGPNQTLIAERFQVKSIKKDDLLVDLQSAMKEKDLKIILDNNVQEIPKQIQVLIQTNPDSVFSKIEVVTADSIISKRKDLIPIFFTNEDKLFLGWISDEELKNKFKVTLNRKSELWKEEEDDTQNLKKVLIDDDFLDVGKSRNIWKTGESKFIKAYLRDNKYILESKGKLGATYFPQKLNYNKNYTIDLTIRPFDGGNESFFGLIWKSHSNIGKKKKVTNIFGITNSRQAKLAQYEKTQKKSFFSNLFLRDTWVTKLEKTSFDQIIPHSRNNTLTIIKSYQGLVFLINNYKLTQVAFDDMYGLEFGIFITENLKVEIDHFKIVEFEST